MPIACLVWGSIYWRPDGLPIQLPWHEDGPPLQIEFARRSKNKTITLVITDTAAPVPVLWIELDVPSLDCAIVELVEREGLTNWIGKTDPRIGWVGTGGMSEHAEARAIAAWAARQRLDGVVWTALRPKFDNKEREPTVSEVIRYLSSLPPGVQKVAEAYVRRAPHQIRTAYRACIEQALGWHPSLT